MVLYTICPVSHLSYPYKITNSHSNIDGRSFPNYQLTHWSYHYFPFYLHVRSKLFIFLIEMLKYANYTSIKFCNYLLSNSILFAKIKYTFTGLLNATTVVENVWYDKRNRRISNFHIEKQNSLSERYYCYLKFRKYYSLKRFSGK